MNFKYENQKIKQGYSYIIGCDEVGRGCLAGPVVAAAVTLKPEFINLKSVISNLKEVKDSKLLTASKREQLSTIIKKYFLWSIAEVSSQDIDAVNIHNASLLAMRKAGEALMADVVQPHGLPSAKTQVEGLHYTTKNDKLFLAVDGKFKIPGLSIMQEPIIGGDNKVLSIAAASIIAKVYRDGLMRKFDKQYPNYELTRHKGYATLIHRTAIIKNGLSPIHRLSFCQNLI